MNCIYLNENLQYSEAFADDNGIIVIPERNVICGFIEGGMLYTIQDEKNDILTPFEVFVMFHDMSIDMVGKHRFQQENRVIDLNGLTFCQTKQIYSCRSPFVSVNGLLKEYFKSTFEPEIIGPSDYKFRYFFTYYNNELEEYAVNHRLEFTLSMPGYHDLPKVITLDPGNRFFYLYGNFSNPDLKLMNFTHRAFWLDDGSSMGSRGFPYLNAAWSHGLGDTIQIKSEQTRQDEGNKDWGFITVTENDGQPFYTSMPLTIDSKDTLQLLQQLGGIQVVNVNDLFNEMQAYNSADAILDPEALNPEFFNAWKDSTKLELITLTFESEVWKLNVMASSSFYSKYGEIVTMRFINEDESPSLTCKFYSPKEVISPTIYRRLADGKSTSIQYTIVREEV